MNGYMKGFDGAELCQKCDPQVLIFNFNFKLIVFIPLIRKFLIIDPYRILVVEGKQYALSPLLLTDRRRWSFLFGE